MKKLFANPHYNVMDRLDIYIDDYSQPDPLPQSMLRQIATTPNFSICLKKEKNQAPPLGDDARYPDSAAVSCHSRAQDHRKPVLNPPSKTSNPSAAPDTHDHTDLRLQPNHAAGRPELWARH